MNKQKHKLKPRYIFFITATTLILIGYFVFLCTYCRNYTIKIMLNGTTNLSTVLVECSNDNTVKVVNMRQDNFNWMMNALEIDIESISYGDTDLTVFFDDIYNNSPDDNGQPDTGQITEHRTFATSFHVLPFGMIYCTAGDNFNGLWTIKLLSDALLIVLTITFALSFREKQKAGNFTYSMVALGGMVFFLTIIVINSLLDTFSSIDYSSVLNFENVLYSVSRINTTFVNVTLIPFLAFCLALSISNILLVRHEGFSIFNLLGVLLGISVIAGTILMCIFGNDLYMYSETEQILMIVINTSVSFAFCYLECLLISTTFCAIMSTRYKIKTPMDYIIILGCAIRGDGTPTPILRSRIDCAIDFDKEQYKKWNKHAKFVTSGGQGSDEVISEAECMKRYLMEQGVPEESILKEDKSVNTYQNFAFSKKVIEADADDLGKTGIAFSTTNYHVFRGYTLAQKIGMTVKGLSAKTKLYFFPNAFLREFIGLLVEQKIRHLFVIISGILFFVGLYIIVQY